MTIERRISEAASDLETMIAVATIAHEGQKDKGGQPYILHPMRVMLSMAKDDNVGRIVAMGHDLVEDTAVTLEQVRSEFGSRVADAIDSLTRRQVPFECDEYKCDKNSHSPIPEQYMQFIGRVAQNEIATRVKLMDIADNTRPERYHPSITGLKGRYDKAREFLTAALLEYNSRETIEFLAHTNLIDIDEVARRLRTLSA